MFQNYLVTALRNIAQHKLHSFINIAGLVLGLICVKFIALFVLDELSYDRWIPDTANLYRAEITFNLPGRPPLRFSQAPFPLPIAMRNEIPGVKAITRLVAEEMTVTIGNRRFYEHVDVVDPNFLQVIKLPLVAGDSAHLLEQPESVVLSESVARKYFGGKTPMGQTILINGIGCLTGGADCDNTSVPMKVTGVLRDLPHNTQLVADVLLPNTSAVDRLSQFQKQNWESESAYDYILLAKHTDPTLLTDKIKRIMDQFVDYSKLTTVKMPGSKIEEIRLTPFLKVHLTADQYDGLKPPGSWTTIYGLSVIGVLILFVACFNFTNLTTARATLRAREISLRKCMGAKRKQLIVQFLAESTLITMIALLIALALAEILLPAFDQLVGEPLTFHYLSNWPLVLTLFAVSLVIGILSGSYPALVLSRFRPATTLRTNRAGQDGSKLLRTLLVIMQFAVSIGLGTVAVVVFLQTNFARNLDLGFRYGDILILESGQRLSVTGRQSLADALAAVPGVISVTRSNIMPFVDDYDVSSLQLPGSPQALTADRNIITADFFSVYGMKILAGRELSPTRGEDTYSMTNTAANEGHSIIINATAARQLGFSTANQAVGKTLLLLKTHMTIVGVVSDALVLGSKSSALPMFYIYAPESARNFSIRLNDDQISTALPNIDRVWRAFVPNAAIQRYFLSDLFENWYQADEKEGTMFDLFTCLSVALACLGLFGLAAFTANRRTKEIGIRKIFGGRTRNIVFLLVWEFSFPVLIANVIAWPLAWYYLHGWLQSFAYRITLSPFYFLSAGSVALAIAWATISFHALRVARSNPINALRYE